MASAQGEVAFLDGEATRRLVYGINALCALEDEFDCAIEEVGQKLTPVLLDANGDPVIDPKSKKPKHKPVKLNDIRAIFRAGLVEHWDGGEPTHAEAGRIISDLGLAKATGLLEEAFSAAFPDAVVRTGAGGNAKKG